MFRGHLLHLVVEEWPSGEREVVHHPGAAAMVAFAGEDVVLVRQVRESIRQQTIEIPAGILDVEGESALQCAVRELLEETGYRAHGVRELGSIHPSPGFSDEHIQLFTCRAARERDPQEEGLEVVRMPLSDAPKAIREGRITDGKTVSGLLLAADRGR